MFWLTEGWEKRNDSNLMVDFWLYIGLLPSQKFSTDMETSSLPVKDYTLKYYFYHNTPAVTQL
jgi:hypothetical protein